MQPISKQIYLQVLYDRDKDIIPHIYNLIHIYAFNKTLGYSSLNFKEPYNVNIMKVRAFLIRHYKFNISWNLV